jgi:hypothetical protein
MDVRQVINGIILHQDRPPGRLPSMLCQRAFHPADVQRCEERWKPFALQSERHSVGQFSKMFEIALLADYRGAAARPQNSETIQLHS